MSISGELAAKKLTVHQKDVLSRIDRSGAYGLTIWHDAETDKARNTEGMHNAGVTVHMALVLKHKGFVRFAPWPDDREITRGRNTYRPYKILTVTEDAEE